MVVASLFTSELAAVKWVTKASSTIAIPLATSSSAAYSTIHRRLEEFFTPEELEEMQEPGYFDEIEEILKKAPS